MFLKPHVIAQKYVESLDGKLFLNKECLVILRSFSLRDLINEPDDNIVGCYKNNSDLEDLIVFGFNSVYHFKTIVDFVQFDYSSVADIDLKKDWTKEKTNGFFDCDELSVTLSNGDQISLPFRSTLNSECCYAMSMYQFFKKLVWSKKKSLGIL